MSKIINLKRKLLFITGAIIILLLFLFQCSACSHENNTEEDTIFGIEGQSAEGFEDGAYCADVTYYNPNTGTENTYTLEVEVYNNEVTQINWNNGGWLDEDHFSAPVLDENGSCSFTSDKGYDYTVEITGKNCSNLDSEDKYRSKNLPKYTFEEAVDLLNMTQEEIEECDSYEEGELLSENDLGILKNYLKGIRVYLREMKELDGDYTSVEDIKQSQRKLQQEINEGYIIGLQSHTMGGLRYTTVKIKKRGIVYLFEVQGNSECTMGTARFDENKTGWQMVYIKQYPDRDEYSGHYMRIIERGI
jgi:hypothetical protein